MVECPKDWGGEGVHGHLSLSWGLCARGYVLTNPVRFRGIYLLLLAFLANAGIGSWPNGGQAVAIGAILASRQAIGSNNF